ncbi:hypothetical protein HUW51_03080 [Adhaeribacter swui]|uniref:Uncharacterized protein n=1 Tax=Adhaeribacter swui TaxID=2086471 RepID=A0A7G7G3L9_9BACT|nr:hypothetical protein [Adhaeribacter swui]QNF31753.1 hypothetical protein HUW51_03080 [Adhaeribacter swui]
MLHRNHRNYIFFIFLLWASWSCTAKQENQTTQPENQSADNAAKPAPSNNSSTASIDSSRLIVPGKSIGLTALQEKAEAVTARLGKPDQGDAAMGKALSTWFSKPAANAKDTTRHQTTLYFKTNMGAPNQASRVDQIRVTSPYFITTDSVHVNASLSVIQKAFPGVVKAGAYPVPKTTGKIFIYDAAAAGIAFEINEQERCVAITVHAANQQIKNNYLPLNPDIEWF